MRLAASLLLIVSIGAGIVPLSRADETITCPKRAEVSGGTIAGKSAPEGFESFVVPTSVLLSGVTVFDGPPKDGASLKPTTVSAHGASIKWDLQGATDRGTWVSCDYANGLVRLVRKLDQPASVCAATIKKSGSPRMMEASFRCK
jgi:hypothetical protein